MRPTPAAKAAIVRNEFRHIVGQKQESRKTRRQNACDLDQAFLADLNRRQSQGIANDYVSESRHMLVAAIAVRINYADVLYHAVVVDDAIGRTVKNCCHAAFESLFRDRLLPQPFPSAAVQYINVGQVKPDALVPERLHELRPDDMGKTAN